MDITIIVAMSENRAIGKDNNLLWHISGDLKRFKAITTGHPVIMGSKTYLSLPKRPLVDRQNIVISRKCRDNEQDFEGAIIVNTISDALNAGDQNGENFIIGGGMIYNEFMPLANKIYLTIVHKEYEGDTFFPEIDYNKWEITEKEEHLEHDPPFSYLTLVKKNS